MPSTIAAAIAEFISLRDRPDTRQTRLTYAAALRRFAEYLAGRGIDAGTAPLETLEDAQVFAGWLDWLREKEYSQSTQSLYKTAVTQFYEFLETSEYARVSSVKLRGIAKLRGQRQRLRIPTYPREELDRLVEYAATLDTLPANDDAERLRNLRDKALILLLADSGVRIHEAVGLRRSHIDASLTTIITGKGNKDRRLYFSERTMTAIRAYLAARAELDGATGKPLRSLPVFARHDKGAGKRVTAITTRTGENVITQRAFEALGNFDTRIHPHQLRHRFATAVTRATGNLEIARELCGHESTETTRRYTHHTEAEIREVYDQLGK